MHKKWQLIVVFITLILFTVYILQDTNVEPQLNSNSAKIHLSSEKTLDKPIEGKLTNKLPKSKPVSKNTSCKIFEQTVTNHNHNKASFISAKAVQWYFEGYDKFEIAETLAATFDYSFAMQWIEMVNNLSRYHALHAELLQAINTLEYSGDTSRKQPYLQNFKPYQLSIYTDIDLVKRFNQYPDIVFSHWFYELHRSLRNKNIEGVLNAISQLQSNITNPLFFYNPIRSVKILSSLSSFTNNEIEQIVTALFNLAPVIETESAEFDKFHKQILIGLGVGESFWNFKLVEPNSFIASFEISQLIELAYKNNHLLNKGPITEDLCDEQVTKIKTLTLNSAHPNSSAWQSAKSMVCPDNSVINTMISTRKKLNSYDLTWKELGSFENLIKHSSKLKLALDSFDEYEQSQFFVLLSHRNSLTLQQIKILINNKLAPTNSNFLMFISSLPIAQQKQLLLKYQHDLAHFNGLGFSLIHNTIMYSKKAINDKLIPFLVDQGFALKSDKSIPDPLWMQLMQLHSRPKLKVPRNTISSLLNHTKLNETHTDAMFKIKQKSPSLYQSLIDDFPKLDFEEPAVLIDIKCE